MNKENLVTVIVPIFKVEKYLCRCLDSILSQTYRNLEIILVDDGSPDNCGDMCEKYAVTDSRIHVIHKQNAGLGMARNSGLDVAKGDYVTFVDSDDYIDPEHIANLVEALTRNNADFVVSGYIRDEKNGLQKRLELTQSEQVFCGCEEIKAHVYYPLLGAKPSAVGDIELEMSVWGGLYVVDIINRNDIRFFSERDVVSEDLLFNMLYALHIQKAAFISNCCYHYCDNDNSLTNTYREDRFEKYIQLLNMQFEIIEANSLLTQDAITRLHRAFLMRTKKCIASIIKSDLNYKKKQQLLKQVLENVQLQQIVKEYEKVAIGINQKIVITLVRYKMRRLLYLYYSKR